VTEEKTSGGRIPELDGLRGVAIGLVILCHYVANAEHRELGAWAHRTLSGLAFGWSGVDLFFVLSGFLIGGILVDAREAPHYFRAFYLRRVHRILPVYYSWILVFVLVASWGLWAGRTIGIGVTREDLAQVPVHLAFLQNFLNGLPAFAWIWLSVTWSLAVEEQFYLLAPPLIRWLSLRNLAVALWCTICLAPVLRVVVFRFLPSEPYAATFWMPCRADALAMGVLLALNWRNERVRTMVTERAAELRKILLVLGLGVAMLLWWLIHPVSLVTVGLGYTWVGLFYSCLLLTVISQKQGWIAGAMRWKWLGRLGRISYCVYVIHFTVSLLAFRLILGRRPEVNDWRGVAVTVLALVTTLSMATAS
jgi:peptidoglycan/LPS O-acetylase OafA/YrhL